MRGVRTVARWCWAVSVAARGELSFVVLESSCAGAAAPAPLAAAAVVALPPAATPRLRSSPHRLPESSAQTHLHTKQCRQCPFQEGSGRAHRRRQRRGKCSTGHAAAAPTPCRGQWRREGARARCHKVPLRPRKLYDAATSRSRGFLALGRHASVPDMVSPTSMASARSRYRTVCFQWVACV